MRKWFGKCKQHDLSTNSRCEQVPGILNLTLASRSLSEQNEATADDKNKDGDEDLQFCCISGLVTSITVGVLLFFAIPAGILLSVYAASNNDHEVLVVGIVLTTLPVLAIPLIVVILYNRRRIRQLSKRHISASSVCIIQQ